MFKSMRAGLTAVFAAGALGAAGCATTGHNSCGTDACGGGGCGSRTLGHAGHAGRGADGTFQDRYNACVDPCWPERYSYQARELTLQPFAAQAANGHALDQTILNQDFEPSSEVLTLAGRKKIDILTRRRPVDGRLFVQTSRDVIYDAANSNDYVKTRADLDTKRAAAVMAYAQGSTAGRGLTFDVAVSDPQDQLMPVLGPANATRGYPNQFFSGIAGLIGVNQGGAGGVAQVANVTGSAGGFAGQPGQQQGGQMGGQPGAPR